MHDVGCDGTPCQQDWNAGNTQHTHKSPPSTPQLTNTALAHCFAAAHTAAAAGCSADHNTTACAFPQHTPGHRPGQIPLWCKHRLEPGRAARRAERVIPGGRVIEYRLVRIPRMLPANSGMTGWLPQQHSSPPDPQMMPEHGLEAEAGGLSRHGNCNTPCPLQLDAASTPGACRSTRDRQKKHKMCGTGAIGLQLQRCDRMTPPCNRTTQCTRCCLPHAGRPTVPSL